MSRMVIFWMLFTAVSVLFTYFVDRSVKFEIGHWALRIAAAGIVWAVIFGTIIFLERI